MFGSKKESEPLQPFNLKILTATTLSRERQRVTRG